MGLVRSREPLPLAAAEYELAISHLPGTLIVDQPLNLYMRKNLFDMVLRPAITAIWVRTFVVASSIVLAAFPAVAGSLLISNGSPVKILVPPDDSLGASWRAPAFDDATWLAGTSAVGYQSGPGGTTPG